MLSIGDYSVDVITEDDLPLLLKWRNSDRIHSMMLTDHKITWDEHYNWYLTLKKNDPPRNLMFKYKNQPIGYIGYTAYNEKNKICSPGTYLGDSELVQMEAGFFLGCINIEYAFSILGMKRLETFVLKKNRRVIKANKSIGYIAVPENDKIFLKNNVEEDAAFLYLTLDNWTVLKENEEFKSLVQMLIKN